MQPEPYLRLKGNYSTTRKELFALVWGCEHFESYLCGKGFLARTDHSALVWLRNFKNPRGEVARWLERLSDFNWPGHLYGNAYGLSSIPWAKQELDNPDSGSGVEFVQLAQVGLPSRESIRFEQDRDPVLSQVSRWLQTGERPPRNAVEAEDGNCYHIGHSGGAWSAIMAWFLGDGKMEGLVMKHITSYACLGNSPLRCCVLFRITLQRDTLLWPRSWRGYGNAFTG